MFARKIIVCASLLFGLTGRLLSAEELPRSSQPTDVWIYSGQSNMQKIASSLRSQMKTLVTGHKRGYADIYVASPGKPVEAWLDPQHRDHKLWASLSGQIAAEKAVQQSNKSRRFAGFVWYQGEANVGPKAGSYQKQLTELVKRVRQATGQPQLPVIVVQLAAATSYNNRDWAVGVIREAQRRFVRDDTAAALVAAIDAEIGDYAVHLSESGADLVSRRVVFAADRLAYQNRHAYWGPQFKRAYFGDKARKQVLVDLDELHFSLELEEGWLSGFAVSRKTKLPKSLHELADADVLGQYVDDVTYPASGCETFGFSILLEFDDPLPADARLSYAAPRNAHYGPNRRWPLEFGGVHDTAGSQLPAFVLVPIETIALDQPAQPTGPLVFSETTTPKLQKDWQQIAINCIGRLPAAVTKPVARAGWHEDDWRQAWWNPASSGLVPNLFDRDGRVTTVGFRTGVWYMSPHFEQRNDADDFLMASWCKNSSHGFTGLTPGDRYDLVVYLLQGVTGKEAAEQERHRTVRVQVLQPGENKRRRLAKPLHEQTVQVPVRGDFPGYQLADGKQPGHVVVCRNLTANANGELELTVQVREIRNGKERWADTTLSGVQIRRCQN